MKRLRILYEQIVDSLEDCNTEEVLETMREAGEAKIVDYGIIAPQTRKPQRRSRE